ncbi:MAG: tetratricopeptide repeat protein [Methanoregula sp.]|jgi:tetratricopeptide (TPR) repeat protein
MKADTSLILALLLVCSCIAVSPVAAQSADSANLYSMAQELTASGNMTAALEACDAAITADPQYADAWNCRADILNRVHQKTDDPLATLNMALTASNQALELNASSPEYWINNGQILYNIGYFYKDQLNDQTTANTYFNKQLASFEKAIELEPDNAEAWFNKAYALCGLGRCTEGVEDFKKVQQIEPDYPYLEGNLKNAEKLAASETDYPYLEGNLKNAEQFAATETEYPYLEGNLKDVEKLAASETPFYVRYWFDIVIVIIAIIGAALWYRTIRRNK